MHCSHALLFRAGLSDLLEVVDFGGTLGRLTVGINEALFLRVFALLEAEQVAGKLLGRYDVFQRLVDLGLAHEMAQCLRKVLALNSFVAIL